MNLNHIGIEVSDIFGMELFYIKFFKFKTVYRYGSLNQKGLYSVIMKNGGVTIELLERPDTDKNRNSKTHHIAFTSGDVAAEYSRLKSLGLENITKPRVTGDGFIEATAADPEGNIIEITKRVSKTPRYPVKAVIFDLDGTVIDSEPNYYEGDRRLLMDYGIELTPEIKEKYIGMRNVEMMNDMKNIYGITDDIKVLLERKDYYYLLAARNGTRVFPEMIKFIRILKDTGYKLAIASGTSPGVLKEIMDITGLFEFFHISISAESMEMGKPAPDVFLEASEKLGTEPLNCAVVEDSQYGVEAAKRARMLCIAVPYASKKPLADGFLMADLLFRNGMSEFRAFKAYKWIKRHS